MKHLLIALLAVITAFQAPAASPAFSALDRPFEGKWSWVSPDSQVSVTLEMNLYDKAMTGIDGEPCYGVMSVDDGAGEPDVNSITDVAIDGNVADIVYICSRSFDDVPAKGRLEWDSSRGALIFTMEGYLEDDAQGGCCAVDVVFLKK